MDNKIAKKRLKRKRELLKRVKCHGSNNSCLREHPVRKKVIDIRPPTPKKVKLLDKLKKWIKRLFHYCYDELILNVKHGYNRTKK